MTHQPTRSGRQARRRSVRSGRTTSQHFDAGWPKRLQAGNAAILKYQEIMKKRRPSAK